MTQLRTRVLEELRRRNYSPRTAKTYVRIVSEFAAYFHQSRMTAMRHLMLRNFNRIHTAAVTRRPGFFLS